MNFVHYRYTSLLFQSEKRLFTEKYLFYLLNIENESALPKFDECSFVLLPIAFLLLFLFHYSGQS
jgi:hypothetical protein